MLYLGGLLAGVTSSPIFAFVVFLLLVRLVGQPPKLYLVESKTSGTDLIYTLVWKTFKAELEWVEVKQYRATLWWSFKINPEAGIMASFYSCTTSSSCHRRVIGS